jgi:hypothetical protein
MPGSEAGTIFVPGVGPLRITDWRQDIIYDVEVLPVAIPAGQTYIFFRNLAIAGVPKTRLQTNMVTPSQLPSGHRAIVYGIHFLPMPNSDYRDSQTVIANGYAEFVTGDTKREKSGPLFAFPSPFGITGHTAIDGAGAYTEISNFNNGVPSEAAQGKLSIPIDLTNEMTFQCNLTFFNAVALGAALTMYCYLRAYIQTPVR